MRGLLSFLLLALFIPLTAGGGFEISGANGLPKLAVALALGLSGQLALFLGGAVSTPRKGSFGVGRGLAVAIFLLGSLSLPVTLFEIGYRHFARVGNDELGFPNWQVLAWSFAVGLGSIIFLALSTKLWCVRRGTEV
jgi:hypothetical protein